MGTEDVKIVFSPMAQLQSGAHQTAGQLEGHADDLLHRMRATVGNGWDDDAANAQLEQYQLVRKNTGYHIAALNAEGAAYGEVLDIGQQTLSRVMRLVSGM
ncbi:hypothetical protein ABT369_09200 [Dactylosporangium sp. NPDC000244]|uniref:hypothetical protein n=1 Tax=Dactylosporangium sp. NPDC000244 TaxID=3154365 RepID=UPI003324DA71